MSGLDRLEGAEFPACKLSLAVCFMEASQAVEGLGEAGFTLCRVFVRAHGFRRLRFVLIKEP